ncbi:MAG: SpoIIE family protein phosphatase [Bilophila wadsworthia]
MLYANGGHNPRFGSATTAWHGSSISGPVVGAMEGMNYTCFAPWSARETLFLYTDGVNEAMNAKATLFQRSDVPALASHHHGTRPVLGICLTMSVHVNGNTASDDMTILCVRYFGKG